MYVYIKAPVGKDTQKYVARSKKCMHKFAQIIDWSCFFQDLIALPYITEQGTLEKTLKCSKKRYDGYVRMWKRKLYDFVAVQVSNYLHIYMCVCMYATFSMCVVEAQIVRLCGSTSE